MGVNQAERAGDMPPAPFPIAVDSAPASAYASPAAWTGAQMRQVDTWSHALTGSELEELLGAARRTLDTGRPLAELDRTSFPLPTLGPRLARFRREVVRGRGFQLIRGLPVDRLSREESARAYWGIGVHIGRPVSQNAAGDLLGHVCNLGYDVDDPNVRTYQTTARQYYHADSCDIVGLMCLHPAKRGGLSSLVSSVTVYNELLATRPELAALLSRPLAVDRRGEVPAGRAPFFMLATFNHFAGMVSSYYSRRYYESAQRFEDAPRLTQAHREAFDLVDALMEREDLHLDMAFEPGDVQLVHNHTVLHDRTAFEDWPEPGRRRHLLRLWLCPEDGRPLPAIYADRWGSVEIGNRGGIRVPGASLKTCLEPG